ncbi:MAG: N-acetylmuramoyl-L-alanine amidase [Elusimicrobiota bacterium]|jgi:N-acetylmuramoyl-L-alanine amidase
MFGSAAWFLSLILCACAHAESLQVVKDGKAWGRLDVQKTEGVLRLSVQDIGRLYGARVDHYRAAKKSVLSMHGKKAVLPYGGLQVEIDGRRVELEAAVLDRRGGVMVPAALLQSDVFCAASGWNARLDARTGLLTLEARASVGPLRWAAYPDHTRVVLELQEGLAYKSEKRGLRGVEFSLPRGVLDRPQTLRVGDGIIESVSLQQESQQARMSVLLDDERARWTVHELGSPRRLVLDVFRPEVVASIGPLREGGSSPVTVPVPAVEPALESLRAPVSSSEAEVPVSSAPAVEVSSQAPKAPVQAAAPRRWRVAIDPGHGGKDSGAPGLHRLLEKDVNLAVAREFARLLEEKGSFEVFLTRQTDVFIPLSERSRLSNEWGADLFISLHCNAHPSRSERGLEIYFLSERASDPEAERLAEFENSVLALEDQSAVGDEAAQVLYQLARAEFINDSSELSGVLAKDLRKSVGLSDRGVKQASFYVLRGANAPAVLIEMGFVTNPQDASRLQTRSFRNRCAQGLYDGLMDYAKRKGVLDKEGAPRR